MAIKGCYENLFDLDSFDDEELKQDPTLIDEERLILFPPRTINNQKITRKESILESLISSTLGEESIIEEELFFKSIEEFELKTMKEALTAYLDLHCEEITKEEPSIKQVKKRKKINRRSNY